MKNTPDQEKQIEDLIMSYQNGLLSAHALMGHEGIDYDEEVEHIKEEQSLMSQMAEAQPVTEELEQAGYSAAETFDAGVIYAPYIPLYETPTVHLSEIQGPKFYTDFKPKIYKISNYNEIYSDIKERFKLLDL